MEDTAAQNVKFKLRLIVLLTFCLVSFWQSLVYYHGFESHYFKVKKFGIEMDRKYMSISECNCSRKMYYDVEDSTKKKGLKSSCSDPGTFVRSDQKVISYSFYLPKTPTKKQCNFTDVKPYYREGILENLRTMRLNYPTYTMRIYTDVPMNDFCPITCVNPDLFWCNIEASPLHGNQSQVFFMIWRFLPLGDPTVDHFLSRDLDSILTERETAVVTDWLKLPEKKAIHVMRDKMRDHNVPILGGMWGASNSLLGRSRAESLLALILNVGTTRHNKGFDQNVLNSVLFHPLKKEIVAYDSYHCNQWRKYTLVKPFPRKRENNSTDFVGNVCLGRKIYSLEKCPLECRPENGKDWEWC